MKIEQSQELLTQASAVWISRLKVPACRGAWEVVWSEGTMAWRALVARAVQRVAGNCRAGQCFDESSGMALNFAELFDKRCIITGELLSLRLLSLCSPSPPCFPPHSPLASPRHLVLGQRDLSLLPHCPLPFPSPPVLCCSSGPFPSFRRIKASRHLSGGV